MSLTYLVSIKNAGKVYDIELEQEDTGLIFKQKIKDVTGIPELRQKILVKGGKIDDELVMSSLGLNLKQPIMVLGTPDKNLPSNPATKQVFLEDMNESQLNNVGSGPSGLVNLGNTCYLNSSLQAIYQIDDLASKISEFKSSGINSTPNETLTASLKNTFNQMSQKQERINPTLFLALFRNVFPQFAERSDHGFYKQQDAEEALSQLLTVVNQALNTNDYFRLSFKIKEKCLAIPDEEAKISYDDAFKLNCHIDIKTNFLRDGIINGLSETIEKYNDTLQSNTEYELKRTITRLPKYLIIHFMRFFWRRDTQKKSKILRRVQFPFELDLAEMLDDSIKPEKAAVRDKIRKIEKDNLELIRDFKKAKKNVALNPVEQQEEDELKVASIKSRFEDELAKVLPKDFNIHSSSENPSSVYELTAVVTHAGSSADSGHYQAFVRDPNDLDKERWWKFNDDKVSSVNREKIEALAGGGESDSALLLFYKAMGL
ncbi:uncharacterized protein PRCAT00000913001 [Priceomyces carsonii]|uniref:uncharacterized protein n=1 Tax=Priceomyces carsonii TaxID=28549 RepID=UPI002EDA9055|nr:unnamed protein product [Priceomyces carsonii]